MTAPTARIWPRWVALLVMASLTWTITAQADHVTDPGTTGDAGGTRETATLLSGLGSYIGYLDPKDSDWYVMPAASVSPSCISLDTWGENNVTYLFSLESGAQYRNHTGYTTAGGSRYAGIATPTLDNVVYGSNPSPNDPNSGNPARPGHYTFHTTRTTGPSSASNDGFLGVDAGSSTSDAISLQGSCTGGKMSPLSGVGDTVDTYAFTLTEATDVTYSLATSLNDRIVGLQILDEAGNVVGDTIYSGDMSTVSLPSGTFYMQTSYSSASLEDVVYLIGVIGPPDPGSTCRPNC